MPRERDLASVLSDFAVTMVTDFDIQAILQGLVGRIVEMLPITAAGVTLIAPDTMPRYVAASDDAALRYEQLQSELGEGPCLVAYRTDRAVTVPDLAHDGRFGLFGPRAVQAGLAAVFTFPLRQGEKPLGALDLYRDSPGPLDDDDLAAAQTLADVTAAYIVNAERRRHLQDASERSYQSSVHDPLTGLPNRILLLERLDRALIRCRRSQKIVAVLFADLDGFKAVNDLHGHRSGDALLIDVSRRLTALLRPSDTLARLAGDEFVILCEDLDEEAHAEVIATRIASALVAPFELPGGSVRVSASVGVAFAGAGSEHRPEELLEDADIAMYAAKHKGGGRHLLVRPQGHPSTTARLGLQRDLHMAIDRDELRTDYQPIVRTEDGRVVAVEALLRWSHPIHGLIPPAVLIPLAEQAGLMDEIGRWVLEKACADRQRWTRHTGNHNFGMSVNISTLQLMSPDFVMVVAEVLTDSDTPPWCLTFEITENVFVRDSDRAILILQDLKNLGLQLALDDFGAGYSSLAYLDRFPVDVLKIDPEYTARLGQARRTHHIIAKVIEMAHLLHMGVVVEGVEAVEQLHEIAVLGGEYCQGFYFARPMSADSLDLLNEETTGFSGLHLPAVSWP